MVTTCLTRVDDFAAFHRRCGESRRPGATGKRRIPASAGMARAEYAIAFSFLRVLRLFPAFLCFGLAGCLAHQGGEVPPPEASRAEMFQELRQRRYPRAYRGIASMQLRFSGAPAGSGFANPLVPEGSFSGRAVLLLRGPDSLRLEPLSLFGAPLMIVVAQGGSFRAYSPSRNAIYAGRTDGRGIGRILGIPLDSGIFVKLLLGDWLAVLGDEKNFDFRKMESAYSLEAKGEAEKSVLKSVTLGLRDWHPRKMKIRARRGAILVRYGAFLKAGGAWRPSSVEIVGPGGENRLHVSYSPGRGAVNAAFSDELFRFAPPRGAETIWLGE